MMDDTLMACCTSGNRNWQTPAAMAKNQKNKFKINKQ